MRGVSLTYNGVKIALTKTNSVSGRPVMSQDGMTYLYTEFTIDVNGVINPEEMAYQDIDGPAVESPGTPPYGTYNAVRRLLKEPRADLEYTNFGGTIFRQPNSSDLSDAANGPIPLDVTLTRLDGGRTFHVRFVVKTFIHDCTFDLGTDETRILSNRYSQSLSIDSDFYSVVTTTGEAYFNVAVLDRVGLVADQMRNRVVPPCVPGMRRVSLDFKVNSQRNIIMYTVVDRETSYDLGDTGDAGSATYVTRVDAVYRQSTIAMSADPLAPPIPTGMQMAVMSVKMWGSKLASQWVMTQLAFGLIGSSKMQFGNKDFGFIRNIEITQSLTERYVEVVVTMQLNANPEGSPFGPFQSAPLEVDTRFAFGGDFGGINPMPPYDAGTRGTAPILLLAAALEAACSEPDPPPCADFDLGDPASAEEAYCGPPPVVSVDPTTFVPPEKPRYSEDTSRRPYTHGYIEERFNTSHGVMQLPKASPPSGGVFTSPGGTTSAAGSDDSPTCIIASVHAPMTRRVVRWRAERVNEPPKIPALQSSDKNQVLIRSFIGMMDQTVLQDDSIVFNISGEYEYALRRDLTTLDKLPYGVSQWVDLAYGDAYVDLSESGDQQHGLIDDGDLSVG